mmetsp:Transcript_3463/g.8141  ORF Transcript_3463/g.8141 Transcript_3463/m.8141 type:complete len:125 (-) Transcript_3463:41-415(-)
MIDPARHDQQSAGAPPPAFRLGESASSLQAAPSSIPSQHQSAGSSSSKNFFSSSGGHYLKNLRKQGLYFFRNHCHPDNCLSFTNLAFATALGALIFQSLVLNYVFFFYYIYVWRWRWSNCEAKA